MTATNYAVAPGEYLEEWIADEGLSQQRVADLLGCSRKQVNEIINGHAPAKSFHAVDSEIVWQNLPPAKVSVYRRSL